MFRRTILGIAGLTFGLALTACSADLADRDHVAVAPRVTGQTAEAPPLLQDTNARYWPLSRISEGFPGSAR